MIVIPVTRDEAIEAFETQSDRFCRLWSVWFFCRDCKRRYLRYFLLVGSIFREIVAIFFLSWTITVDNTHIFGIRSSIINCGVMRKMRINFTNNGMEWYARIHAITIIHAYNTERMIFRRCASHASNEIFVYSPIFA